MAIDRGGLRYDIQVVVRNLKQLRSFRRELTSVTKESRKVTAAQVASAKSLSQISIATSRARKERERANKAAADARLAEQRVNTERQRTITQLRRAHIAEHQLARSRERAQKATDKATRSNTRFRRSLKKTGDAANRISFTFRRLFGIFAAFAAVRQVAAGLRTLVSEGVRFNSFIENATLGVRALLSATGEVFGPTGTALTGLDAFNATSKIASDQLEKLRLDARATAATFQTLLDTFQIALGPGLSAGLNPDQIRKLTVQISQAAAAIGLPQNQLAEEIRSLLTGTIQPRTTRIATVLGISNADVKRAKEAGELAEFLNEKFDAFGVAAQSALGNLSVLLTNTRDDLARLLGVETEGFFEELKDGIAGFRGALDSDDAHEFADALNDALSVTLDTLNQFATGVGFKTLTELINALTKGLGDAFKTIGVLSASFVKALATALTVVGKILAIVGKIAEFFSGGLGFILQWVVTFRIANALLRSMALSALALGASMRKVAVATAATSASSMLAAGSFTTAALAATRMGRVVTFAARGIRLAANLAAKFAGWITVALVAWEVITSLLDDAEEETEKVVVNSEEWANVSDRIPSTVAAANKELELAARNTEKLRKEAEQVSGAFDLAIATRGLEAIAKKIIEGSANAQRQIGESVAKLDEQRKQKLEEINKLQDDLVKNERDFVKLAGLNVDDQKRFTREVEAQLAVEQKIASLQRERNTLAVSMSQTRAGAARDELRDEVKAKDARIKDFRESARILAERRTVEDSTVGRNIEGGAGLLRKNIEDRVELEGKLKILLLQNDRIIEGIANTRAQMLNKTEADLGIFLISENVKLEEQNRIIEEQLTIRQRINSAGENAAARSLATIAEEDAAGKRLLADREKALAFEIRTLESRKKELTDVRAIAEVEARIALLEDTARVARRTERSDRSDRNRKTDELKRSLESINALDPLGDRLEINPSQIAGIEAATRLLKPLDAQILSLQRKAEDLRTKELLGPAAKDALLLTKALRAGEDAQRKFNDAAERASAKANARLKKLAKDRKAAIEEAVGDFRKDEAAAITEAAESGDKGRIADLKGVDSKQGEAAERLGERLARIEERRLGVQFEIDEITKAVFLSEEKLAEIRQHNLELAEKELALREKAELKAAQIANKQQRASERTFGETQTQGEIRRNEADIFGLEQQRRAIGEPENEAQQLRLDTLNSEIGLLEARNALLNQGALGGMTQGMDEFIASADEFQVAADLTEQALNGFSDALADSLETPQEAGKILLDFFKNLISLIIRELIKLAIAKALLAAAGGSSVAEVGSRTALNFVPATGNVDGGTIKGRGYADGGTIAHGAVRPEGLDPRDTQPIWAQPGEFMVRKSVSDKVRPFLEALNGGAFSPRMLAAISSLVAGGRLPSFGPAASSGPGFATGGAIPARSAQSGTQRIVVRSEEIVGEGLGPDIIRAVAPGIKEPRTLAELKGK